MAVRANQLTNFKGEPYITRPELEDAIRDATGGESGLIDSTTGNLRADLNPIKILSMDNEEGMTEETIGEDTPNPRTIIRDEDYSKIKFIGNCNVNYDEEGMIVIRIGDNVNCSLFNKKDGISNGQVQAGKTGDVSGTVSSEYGTVASPIQIFQGTDTIKAVCGATYTTTNLGATSANGATNGTNGTEIHFDDSTCVFKVSMTVGGTDKTYTIGAITENGTYSASDGTNTISGIQCVVTNWGDEPMSSKGATGKSGSVRFVITPSNVFSSSTAFKLNSIELYHGDKKVSGWDASSGVNGTYFYIKETDKPGSPTSVDYSVSATESGTKKQESGVTYLTTSATLTASATEMKNVGYPASVTNKTYIAPNSGNDWFTALYDTATSNFTTWTTAKNVTMDYEKSGISLNSGKFENPQVSLYGINCNGNPAAVSSAKSDNKIWVYGSVKDGSNITDNRWNSSFTAKVDYANVNLTTDTSALQVYQGLLQYPSIDYSVYNVVAGVTTNPNYSSCTGDRYYYMKFSKSGSMPQGALDIVHEESLSSDIQSGKLVFEVAKSASGDTWYDVCFGGPGNDIGQSDSTFGDTTSKLTYVFSDGDANNNIWVRITMKAGCTSKISNVLLNGGSLV